MPKIFWFCIKMSKYAEKIMCYFDLKSWDILHSRQPQTIESLEDLYKRLPPGYLRFRVTSWIDTLKEGLK